MKIGLVLGFLAAFALGFLCREICGRIAAKRAEEETGKPEETETVSIPAEWVYPEPDGEASGQTFDPEAFAAQCGKNPENDALLYEAIEHCLDMGFASISMLQRRMHLGYSAAVRLVDEMETAGIVSKFEKRPRRIFITREEWNAFREKYAAKPEDAAN